MNAVEIEEAISQLGTSPASADQNTQSAPYRKSSKTESFGQCRVRMDGAGQIVDRQTKPDGQRRLAHQIGCAFDKRVDANDATKSFA